jgi:hypothetical protein
VQPGLLVNNVGKVVGLRVGDAAASERFGFCEALLLMQRPNNLQGASG